MTPLPTFALTWLAPVALAMPQSDAAPPTPALLVRAKTIVVSPELTLTDKSLLLRGGRVAAVGDDVPSELGADVQRIDLGNAVVVPGFVLPHTYAGAERDLAETVDAYTPELRALEAYDPFGDAVQRLRQGGVTTLAIAPRSSNTFAGLAGAAKTGPDAGRVLQEQCYLKLALVPESFDQQRFPTSRMGALDLVRAAFRTANAPLATLTPDRQTLRDVTAGAVPLAVHARTLDELCCALDLVDPARGGVLAGSQVKLVLLGAEAAEKCLDRIVALRAAVILEPLRAGMSDERLRLPSLLHGRGVSFAFAAASVPELRMAAALAVRHGLDRRAALTALTTAPAQVLGIADRVGTLLQGRDADLAAFDGDPLDLTSRLLAVAIDGYPVLALPLAARN